MLTVVASSNVPWGLQELASVHVLPGFLKAHAVLISRDSSLIKVVAESDDEFGSDFRRNFVHTNRGGELIWHVARLGVVSSPVACK